MGEDCIIEEKEGIVLSLKVVPSSRRNELAQILNGTLKVRINKAPEKGKANKEIVKFFSQLFEVPRKDIVIISGETSAIKKILIKKLSSERANAVILKHLN